MQRSFFVLTFVFLVVSAEYKRIGAVRNGSTPRNTMQACREDFRKLCRKGDGEKSFKRHPILCLTENEAKIDNQVCRDWVKAESTCWDSAKTLITDGRCDRSKSDIRRCFKSVNLSELSKECTKTDFFVQLRSRIDRRQRKVPKDNPPPVQPQEAS